VIDRAVCIRGFVLALRDAPVIAYVEASKPGAVVGGETLPGPTGTAQYSCLLSVFALSDSRRPGPVGNRSYVRRRGGRSVDMARGPRGRLDLTPLSARSPSAALSFLCSGQRTLDLARAW
jgi:hypothetical protein